MKLPYYYLVKNSNDHILFLPYDFVYIPIFSLSELLCVFVTPSTYVRELVGLNFGLNTGVPNWGFGFLDFLWPYRKIPGPDYSHFFFKFFSIYLLSLFGTASSSYWKRHQVIQNTDFTSRYFYSNALSASILLSSELWPWRWKWYVPSKYCYTPSGLQTAVTRKPGCVLVESQKLPSRCVFPSL